jgi:L-lactate dehydrogenase complex protein LldG
LEQRVTSKEKILKKVRQGLINKSKSTYQNIDLESSVFTYPEGETLTEMFVQSFVSVGGKFVFCDNRFDCIDKLLDLIEDRKWKVLFCREEGLQELLSESGISYFQKSDHLDKIQASITSCEAMLANTGSIMVSSMHNARVLSIWPPVHIVIANRSQIVLDMKESFQILRNKFGKNIPTMISYLTGPSFSNDIPSENEDVVSSAIVGAHGPLEIILFLIDDRKND